MFARSKATANQNSIHSIPRRRATYSRHHLLFYNHPTPSPLILRWTPPHPYSTVPHPYPLLYDGPPPPPILLTFYTPHYTWHKREI